MSVDDPAHTRTRAGFLAVVAVAGALAMALSAFAATGQLLPGDLRIMHDVQKTSGGAALAATADVLYFVRFPLTALAAAFAASRRRLDLVLAAVLVLLALALNPALKEVIDRARPSAAEGVVERAHAGGSGYPSGHAMSIALLSGYGAVAACQLMPRVAALAAVSAEIVTILLVGWMRVYDGVHWPSDVAGGWLIGLLLLFVCLALADRIAGGARD
jgi:undecaprenyl-diphosphatase